MNHSKQKNKQRHGKGHTSNFNRNAGGTRPSGPPAKEYDLFTGGGTFTPDINIELIGVKPTEGTKTSDFTIFYNIAFENVEKVKELMKAKTLAQQNAFWSEYLWKAHFLSKNSNGYELTPL